MIIGVTGKMGAGKTTLVEYLAAKHNQQLEECAKMAEIRIANDARAGSFFKNIDKALLEIKT